MAYPDERNSEESRYFQAIKAAQTPEERRRLIAEFESVPVQHAPFYWRWMRINEVHPLEGSTDVGFDPGRSPLPRDVQLLATTLYGIADIRNGGFVQFFDNSTGMFAPEMIEWFDRAGLPDTAAVMNEAIAEFGTEFPRSRAKRNEFFDAMTADAETHLTIWNRFDELNKRFDSSLPRGRIEEFADRWLRETCCIRRLSDAPQRTVAAE